MRCSEVVEILGCEGTLSYSSKASGYKVESYSWEGLYVSITNGSVSNKSHTGLRPAGVPKPVQKPIVINIDLNIDLTPKAKVEPAPKADPAEVGQKAIDAMPQ